MASFMALPNSSDKSKRSFEYRMSKKVAELTQVVHMLFTRNHEKEVELEALKRAYEDEITEVITDARSKILALEKQLQDMLKQQTGDSDRIRKLLEGEFESKERELKKKLEQNEKRLQEERTECQNLRDMLIRAQLDIENLRQGAADQVTSQTEELAMRDRELEHLKNQNSDLDQMLKERGKEWDDAIKESHNIRDSLERELRHVQGALEDSQRSSDQLLARNKQLEAELKTVRRDLNRKVSDVITSQKLRNGSSLSQAQSEELERLRREVQRYRLELSNRDTSFNRMFTDKQPVYLDKHTGGGGLRLQSHSAGTSHSSSNSSGHNGLVTVKRERTVAGPPPSGPVICFQEQEPSPSIHSERLRARSTPSTHLESSDNNSRLPSICSSPDTKVRTRAAHHTTHSITHSTTSINNNNSGHSTTNTNRLSKPRPLPKEILFGK